MCGIAGWIDHSQDMSERIDLLNRMSETLDRRGPDENGLYINRGAALMHRRLVVIDRENGKQPMSVRHKDTTYVIVYNGELYNTAELREELKASGFHFRGHSDTEVVLKSYIKYGADCCKKLNGILPLQSTTQATNRCFCAGTESALSRCSTMNTTADYCLRQK